MSGGLVCVRCCAINMDKDGKRRMMVARRFPNGYTEITCHDQIACAHRGARNGHILWKRKETPDEHVNNPVSR